jgi:hypothetical protein
MSTLKIRTTAKFKKHFRPSAHDETLYDARPEAPLNLGGHQIAFAIVDHHHCSEADGDIYYVNAEHDPLGIHLHLAEETSNR